MYTDESEISDFLSLTEANIASLLDEVDVEDSTKDYPFFLRILFHMGNPVGITYVFSEKLSGKRILKICYEYYFGLGENHIHQPAQEELMTEIGKPIPDTYTGSERMKEEKFYE